MSVPWQALPLSDQVIAALEALGATSVVAQLPGSQRVARWQWEIRATAAQVVAAYTGPGAPIPIKATAQAIDGGTVIVTGPFRKSGVFTEDTANGCLYTITPGPSLVVAGTGQDLDGEHFAPVSSAGGDDPQGRSAYSVVQGPQQQWVVVISTSTDPETGVAQSQGLLAPMPPGTDPSKWKGGSDSMPPGAIAGPATLGAVDDTGAFTALVTPATGPVVSITARFTSSLVGLSRHVTPSALQLEPASLSSGDQCMVSGQWFSGGEQVDISLDGQPIPGAAPVTAQSMGWCMGSVTIPQSLPSGTHVLAMTGRTSAVLVQAQLSVSTSPVVTSLRPTSGPAAGGTPITLGGWGFTGATAVDFGQFSATQFAVTSDTQLAVTAPTDTQVKPGASLQAGEVYVVVTTPVGSSNTSDTSKFTYVAPPGLAVLGVSPSSGPAGGGTVVTVTGTDLGGTTSVRFGMSDAPQVTVISDTELSVTAPPNVPIGAGAVDIIVLTNTGGMSSATPADQFTFTLSTPTVTGLNPASGPTSGQGMVVVMGSGFAGATSVQFGDAIAKFEVASDTQLFAFVPAGTGTVDVTVTTPVGTSATSPVDQFSYS